MNNTAAEKTYRIVRMHYNQDIPNRCIKRHLTLEEAQTWCKNPETSSKTATSKEAVAYTASRGYWFDGFEEE
jgi:hypothetical protein